MRVYIAERDVYESRYIVGVYATPEAAMAALPGARWEQDEDDWWNELDWSDCGHVSAYDVQDLAPVDR